MSETTISDYIKGFDAGYAYVLNEVEQWIKREGLDTAKIARRLDCSWETADRIQKNETRPDVDTVLVLLDLAL
jgi:hypothetical protein